MKSQGAFPGNAHCPFPKIGQWLVLLGSHLSIHILVEVHRHPYPKKKKKEEEILVKKKTTTTTKGGSDELNTYFSSLLFQWCTRRKQKALGQGNT